MSLPPLSKAAPYRRREPENGLWHKVLRENLLALIEGAKDPEDPESGLPSFVERELTDVLNCGQLSAGFLRLKCPDCKLERLVALSCEARAACPSCGARRMAEGAAYLVDCVLPDVGLRQWVVTAPPELRVLLLADGAFLGAFIRIVVTTIFRHLCGKAAALGIRGGQCGAITFIQRFSSTLSAFPHLHIVVFDGVYTKDGDAPPRFHRLSPPGERDEDFVSAGICLRVERLLERLGLVDPDAAAERPGTPLEKWFARAVVERAHLSAVNADGRVASGGRMAPRRRSTSTGDVAGFSVHARSAVRQGDRAGRERLLKYCLRPPFAERQLSETEDGRIAFELNTARTGGRTHLVLEPLRFLRRVAWLIPPPKQHQTRYAGVLAPAAKLRPEVVPEPPVVAAIRGPPEGLSPGSAPASQARRRLDWARLLDRVHEIDALACPCGGRLRPIAAILDPKIIRKILEHLGVPADPPKLRPARAPPGDVQVDGG